jgi:hypothetical protein
VAWTFAIPEGADLMDILTGYAAGMRSHADSEYVRAYSAFLVQLLQNSFSGPSLASTEVTGGSVDMNLPKDGHCRETRTPVSNLLAPGEARDKVIEIRLREGKSFLDLASTLDRTPEFIIREARRLLGESQLEQLMKHNKKGPWTCDEVQRLIKLRAHDFKLGEMRKLLRRTKGSIQKRLRELGSSILKPTIVLGPQELPPGLWKSLFEARLAQIWDELLTSEMTPTWRHALQEKAPERWLAAVSAGIPMHVKKILGGLQPPTWEELKSFPLVDTKDAGVYARLAESRFEIQTASDRYIYVGSASKYNFGLGGRIAQHTSKIRGTCESRLRREIRRKDLNGNDRFITLMIMKLDSLDKEVVLDVRRTVTLTEAILTTWLGAFEVPQHDLDILCPWEKSILAYSGWASHNPLLVDVVEPRDYTPPDGS